MLHVLVGRCDENILVFWAPLLAQPQHWPDAHTGANVYLLSLTLKQIYKVSIFFDLLLYRYVMNVIQNPRGSFLNAVKYFKIKRSVY